MNDQSASGLGTGFNIPDPTKLPSLKGTVSDAEWAMRVELQQPTGFARCMAGPILSLPTFPPDYLMKTAKNGF